MKGHFLSAPECKQLSSQFCAPVSFYIASRQDLESNPPTSHRVSPRASLTNVVALNGILGGPETKTDVLHPSPATLLGPLGQATSPLSVLEDVRLLLVSALALDGQLGRHDCCAGQSVGIGDDVCFLVGGRRLGECSGSLGSSCGQARKFEVQSCAPSMIPAVIGRRIYPLGSSLTKTH